MKPAISKDIEKIFEENKYDHWIYRTSIIRRNLRDAAGYDIEVFFDGTELKYYLDGEDITKDVTKILDGESKSPKEGGAPTSKTRSAKRSARKMVRRKNLAKRVKSPVSNKRKLAS